MEYGSSRKVTHVGTGGEVGASFAIMEKNWMCGDCDAENYPKRTKCFRYIHIASLEIASYIHLLCINMVLGVLSLGSMKARLEVPEFQSVLDTVSALNFRT